MVRKWPEKFNSERFSSLGDWPYWFVGAVFLITVYGMTLLPGVGYSGDTAKFQFLGKVLGTPHATGYPTYLILNFLFLKIVPWGSPALLSNLLSALFSVAACVWLFLLLRRLHVNLLIALASMLTMGFSPMFWSQSLIAEVYSLNALFMTLVFYQLAAWGQGQNRRRLLAAILIYAISFGNHLTTVTFFPALIVFVALTRPAAFLDKKTILWALGSALVGALQYTYLLWRYHDPSTVFMEIMVPDLAHLWKVVSGAQFKVRMFPFSLEQVVTVRIPLVGGLVWRELGFLLPLAGLALFNNRNRRFLVFLILALIGNLIFTINYDIPDIEVYIIPAVLIMVIFIALGLQVVWQKMFSQTRPVFASLFLLVPLFFLVNGYSSVGQQDNRQSAEVARKTLEEVGSDALLIGWDYHEFYYLAYYLVGEDWQSERNIFIMHHFRLGEVLEYFENDIPITIVDQRLNTPTGLTVYVKSERIVNQLKENGLIVEKTDFGIWKVVGLARDAAPPQ